MSVRLPQNMETLTHEVIRADRNGIDYDVWTWTPPDYEESDQSYPLLILLDAEWNMGVAIDTVAVMSMIGEAQPAIVVGVSTAPPRNHIVQRSIDYSAHVPTAAARSAPAGADFSFWDILEGILSAEGMKFEDGFGGTDAFLSFLTDQLLEDIQSTYRINLEEIGIAGHSSGGDFTADTLLRKQTPFTRFIIGSFGIDVLEHNLAERERAFAETAIDSQLQVFCGYGGAEINDPYLKVYTERGVALLERLQTADPDNLKVTIREFESETHGSVFAHIFLSGYRELCGTGAGFVEAMANVSLSDIR